VQARAAGKVCFTAWLLHISLPKLCVMIVRGWNMPTDSAAVGMPYRSRWYSGLVTLKGARLCRELALVSSLVPEEPDSSLIPLI
jgi:hypothetical protein